MSSNLKKVGIISISIVALFILDRILKLWFQKISPEGVFLVLGDWVKLKLFFNSGIAFGLPLNFYLIIFLYILILLVLTRYLAIAYKNKDYFPFLFLGLIIAGAFSNLFDRLYVGQVIDYIDIKYYSVFNIADVMIVVGVVGLMIRNFKSKIKKS